MDSPAADSASRPRWTFLSLSAVALFTPTIVCLTAVNNILVRNELDIPYDTGITATYAIAFAAAWAGCLLGIRFIVPARRVGARCILGLGVAILLWDVLGVVFATWPRNFVALVAIDEVALGLVVWAMWKAPWLVLFRLFRVVGPLLFAQAVFTHVQIVRNGLHSPAPTAPPPVPAATEEGEAGSGNVYHIILDAFQREYFPVLLREHPELTFDGYRFYERFSSNYGWTAFSIPSMLRGDFYTPGVSMKAWAREAFDDGLWRQLEAGGVDVTLYTHFRLMCPDSDTPCFSADTMGPAPVGAETASQLAVESPTRMLTDLWFLSLMPRSIRLVLNNGLADASRPKRWKDLRYGGWFSITRQIAPGGTHGATSIRRQDLAAVSLRNFERFLAEEPSKAGHGRYTFIHLLMPHRPYVLQADCSYLPSDATTLDGGLAQATCALRLVEQMNALLRELGRYDDALIIVHADHGAYPDVSAAFAERYPQDAPAGYWDAQGEPGAPLPEGEPEGRRTPAHVALRSAALLLVKPPHATGFHTETAPAQMLDIRPTIAAHFGVPSPPLPGLPLDRLAEAEDRPREFFSGSAIPGQWLPVGKRLAHFVGDFPHWRYVEEVEVVP